MRLAEAAARAFGHDGGELRLLANGDNAVYELRSRGRRYALRMSGPGFHDAASLHDELDWLERLAEAEPGIAPVPERSPDGELLCRVGGERDCSLFRWVEGRFVNKRLGPVQLRRVGRLTGRLQALGRELPKPWLPSRMKWSAEEICGGVPWGDLSEVSELSAAQKRYFADVRAQLLETAKAAERNTERVGPIHADLHRDNYLFEGERAKAIDFDLCGVGHAMYDLAMTLADLATSDHCTGANVEALFEGYSEVGGRIEDGDIELIEAYMVASEINFIGFCHARRDRALCRRWLPLAIAAAEKFSRALREGDPLVPR